MLSPRWRKVLRDVWLHKSRTVLVILAISVGITGAGAVLDTWSLVRKVTKESFDASNPPSAVLRTDSIDDVLLAQVRAMPAIELAEARRTVVGSMFTPAGWKTAMFMAAPDFARTRIGSIDSVSGAWPPADGALVVETSSVEFSGAAVGGVFSARVGEGQPVDLPITGIARDVGLAPGWMEHAVYVFVTPATLAQLGAPATMNQLRVVTRDRTLSRAQVREVAGQVRSVVESSGRVVGNVDVPEPRRHIHAAQMNSLLFTQGAFGVLALLLSGFLVVNLVSAMLTGQVREIGVMKTLGARSGQLTAMYLILGLVLGLAACLIAIPLAAVIGRRYAEFTAELLNFDIAGAAIPAWVIGVQVLVGILLPLAASAIPVIKGTRIPVNEAIRDLGLATTAGEGRILRRASGVGRPLLMSLRNAFRRRQRMILTLLTLATGGAVYLGAINLRSSIVASVDTVFGTQRFDMVIRLARPVSPDSIESIARGVAGVAAAEAWSGARAAVTQANGMIGSSFPVSAPPAGSPMLEVPILRGRWLAPGDSMGIVVNRRLLEDEPGIDVGTSVLLTIAGKPSRWEIVGIADAGPAPSAYATREALGRVTGERGATAVVVRGALDGAASQLDLIQRVRSSLVDAGLEVQSGQLLIEQRRVVEDHLLMVAGFLGIMAQLIIVVGGLGLASTMSLAVLERTREIGVLRAIGARHRSIFTIIQVEGLVVAILSWLIAIPLSIPMSVVLGAAFGRIMLPVPLTLMPEWSGVAAWLGIVTLVSVAACAWPAIKAMRVPAARALAFE